MSRRAAEPVSDAPVLEFAVAKRLAYRTRMRWVAALVAVGLLLQVVFVSVLPGIPFLAVAVALAWVVGFDNAVDHRGLEVDRAWRRVPFERVEAILDLDRDMRRWDSSVLDVSSLAGCGTLLLTGTLCGLATLVSALTLGFGVAAIIGFDAAVLVLLQWLSGMRSVHRRPDLVLKARHLVDVVRRTREDVEAAGSLRAQMLLAGAEDGRAPEDVRLLVEITDPPGRLLSVQGQVVLNRVQGTPYPYFYAVVVGDPGRGLAALGQRLAPGGSGTTIEAHHQADVDVVVVRQTTTRTSGYHTKPKVSAQLLTTALGIATTYRDEAAVPAR